MSSLNVLATALLIASVAHAHSMPDTIAPSKALNLGRTSFFEGFGRTDESFTSLRHGRYEDLDRITDFNAHDSPNFKSPSIQVFSAVTQIACASNWHPLGGDQCAFRPRCRWSG